MRMPVLCKFLAVAAGHLNGDQPDEALDIMRERIPSLLPHGPGADISLSWQEARLQAWAGGLIAQVRTHQQRLHQPDDSVS
jgi:hypothetical protein